MNLQTFTLFQSGKKSSFDQVALSKNIVSHIKACRIEFLNSYFDTKITIPNKSILADFIPPNATLVPLPKSAPMVEGAQWPPKEICKVLLGLGYGNSAISLLKRITKVPKAAFQKNSEERPTVDLHYNTIKFERNEIHSAGVAKIVLVDDVITQGRTAYACYKRIAENFPEIPVSLFCLVRTNAFDDFVHCDNPKTGEIIYYESSGKTIHKYVDDYVLPDSYF